MTQHNGKLRNMASIYIRKDNRLLLLFRKEKSIVSNMWIGSAGGHFEQAELNDAKACALRELWEELGLTEDILENLTLRYVTLRYTDSEIRQNYYFFANLANSVDENFASTEGITQWHDLSALYELEMPFTARHVINHYLEIGQFDDSLYGGLAGRQCVTFEKL